MVAHKFPQQFQPVEKDRPTLIKVTDQGTQSIVLQSLQEHQLQARKKEHKEEET